MKSKNQKKIQPTKVLVEFSEEEHGAKVNIDELQKKIRKLDIYLSKTDNKIKLYQQKLKEALEISKKDRDLVASGLKIMKVDKGRSFHV
jgi:hypothetical protein